MSKIIAIYAAVSQDGVYGVGNSLPWPRLAKDMEMFRKTTTGNIIIMGRTTFESLPEKYKPLQNRINIVVSSTMTEGRNLYGGDIGKIFWVFKTIEEALVFAKKLKPQKNIFFIGGREIWLNAIKYCNKSFVTIVHLSCKNLPGPLSFIHELLDPNIAFAKKKHNRETSFSFHQKILYDNKKVTDSIKLDFLTYSLRFKPKSRVKITN